MKILAHCKQAEKDRLGKDELLMALLPEVPPTRFSMAKSKM